MMRSFLRRLRAELYSAYMRWHLLWVPQNHSRFGPYYRNSLRAVVESSRFPGAKASYVVGVVLAALQSKQVGLNRICLIEFGVAKGIGFRCLLNVAENIRKFMDLEVDVIGFDKRDGLPDPKGYRDHPEIWVRGQFCMAPVFESLDSYVRKHQGSLIIGDVADSLQQFQIPSEALAFISVDVDYYSSTKPILDWLSTLSEKEILPASVVYFDDVITSWTFSSWAGEELAIREFNAANHDLKIELKNRDLRLYALHNLRHPVRLGLERPVHKLELYLDNFLRFFSR